MRYAPRNRDQWRDWLRKNHAKETEVWLVFFKKHTNKATLSYNDAVEEAVCFGWIDGIKRSIDRDRYMHRFTPRKPESKWSRSNIARAQRMLDAGRMAAPGRRAIERAQAAGSWDKPVTPPAQLPMPPEFKMALNQNKQAGAFFESLAPSYKRQYTDWIASAKRPETKRRRLEEAIGLLQRGRKLGMR